MEHSALTTNESRTTTESLAGASGRYVWEKLKTGQLSRAAGSQRKLLASIKQTGFLWMET
jgi:hypothetical protein